MVEKCLKRQKSLRREHGIVSPMSPRSPCDTEPRRLATAELSGKWGDLFCAPGCYIDFCGPSARGFAIPFAAVLGQFGPRSNYLYLYANSLLSNYIYMSCKSSKKNASFWMGIRGKLPRRIICPSWFFSAPRGPQISVDLKSNLPNNTDPMRSQGFWGTYLILGRDYLRV
jgi:hypothetical protein